MYETFSTCLRIEAVGDHRKDFGLLKGLEHLDQVRQSLAAVTERLIRSMVADR